MWRGGEVRGGVGGGLNPKALSRANAQQKACNGAGGVRSMRKGPETTKTNLGLQGRPKEMGRAQREKSKKRTCHRRVVNTSWAELVGVA